MTALCFLCYALARCHAAASPLAKPTAANLDRAARAIRAGKLVAFPTETVYGLGGDALSDSAVAAIYAAKSRPRFNPLIVHVASTRDAERIVQFDRARPRAGPRVLARPADAGAGAPRRRRHLVAGIGGLDTLAVRVPDHPVAQRLLKQSCRPIAAPSANASGRVSPTTAAHVADSLKAGRNGARLALILDGGACPVGLESTVVDLSGAKPVLLRHGGVPREDIERFIGRLATAGGGPARSPGQLKSHYAPRLALRLNARRPRAGEAFLAFGAVPPGIDCEIRDEPQSEARSRRSRGEPVRDAARARPAEIQAHRRGADPGARAGGGDQRPPQARRGAAAQVRRRGI